jgi:hypothetical protein
MAEITCRVIPEPNLSEGGVALKQEPTKKSPYFDDNGPDSHHCGNCNFVLAKNVGKDWIQSKIHTEGGLGLVLVCPECNSYNEIGADIG